VRAGGERDCSGRVAPVREARGADDAGLAYFGAGGEGEEEPVRAVPERAGPGLEGRGEYFGGGAEDAARDRGDDATARIARLRRKVGP